MTLNDVLLSLLEAIEASGDMHIVGWDATEQWPDTALHTLLHARLLRETKPAQSIECPGCENRCFMEVHQLPGGDVGPDRAFVICDDPEKHDQMGRIAIPVERLRQWKVTALQLTELIAKLLGIECKAEDRHGQTNLRIGMVQGSDGRRWLSLNKSPLTVELNGHQIPLEEVLFFENSTLAIDQERIISLATKPPYKSPQRYKSSTEKREAGKRKTEAMYADWGEEYQRLRRTHPDLKRYNDSWIAKEIAKLPIAQGRNWDTIRKRMKL